MPVDIIEMLWQCPACRSTVLGRYKACCNCGQFRTPNVKEWMPDDVSHRAAIAQKRYEESTAGLIEAQERVIDKNKRLIDSLDACAKNDAKMLELKELIIEKQRNLIEVMKKEAVHERHDWN
jgi:hypothetical protein